MKDLRALPVLVATAAALLVLPPVLFLGSALYRDMTFGSSIAALLEQYSAERTNLLVVTLLGFVPLLFIALLLGLRRLISKVWDGAGLYACCSVLPVLFVTVLAHLEYWPSWLPNRTFLGFPHGLELVIGPLVFAPAGAILGFLAAWLIWRQS